MIIHVWKIKEIFIGKKKSILYPQFDILVQVRCDEEIEITETDSDKIDTSWDKRHWLFIKNIDKRSSRHFVTKIFDMIIVAYYNKPFIFTGPSFWEEIIFHHRAGKKIAENIWVYECFFGHYETRLMPFIDFYRCYFLERLVSQRRVKLFPEESSQLS